MTRTNVGILRGGTSSEYNLSLKTGAAIIAALPEEKYDVRDILIDRSGMWHARGIPADPARALSQVDVVVNALHGGVGEDGTVQRILDRLSIPYTGSRALAASFSLNKNYTRELARKAGIMVAHGMAFSTDIPASTGEMARAVFAKFGPPYIVKPVSQGASHGILYVATFSELPDAIGDVLDAFGAALVEEYLVGHDVSVGVLENFRGEELYALPPVHVIAPQGDRFLTHDAHEQGNVSFVVPSNFTESDKQALMHAAREAHRALGLSHFSRADMRLTRRGPVLLEMNAIPGLYPSASFPKALDAVGSSTQEFVEHAIQLARQ